MIVLNSELRDRMIKQCLKELPSEACGILAGKAGKVERVYEMTNMEKGPETFFMDAKEQLKIMKEMRSQGLEMVAIYHSHVASQAYPSSHDVELAFYPEASYIIISLKDKNSPSVRSFKIAKGKITEEKLEIVDS